MCTSSKNYSINIPLPFVLQITNYLINCVLNIHMKIIRYFLCGFWEVQINLFIASEYYSVDYHIKQLSTIMVIYNAYLYV